MSEEKGRELVELLKKALENKELREKMAKTLEHITIVHHTHTIPKPRRRRRYLFVIDPYPPSDYYDVLYIAEEDLLKELRKNPELLDAYTSAITRYTSIVEEMKAKAKGEPKFIQALETAIENTQKLIEKAMTEEDEGDA